MYLLHPGMDRTEAMICQHFYLPDIREAVRREVNNCDTSQGTKRSNKHIVNHQLSDKYMVLLKLLGTSF